VTAQYHIYNIPFVGYNDYDNGIAMGIVRWSTTGFTEALGSVNIIDWTSNKVDKGSYTTATGHQCLCCFDFNLPMEAMKSDACDEFVWKRTV
jgi:hypothetical protein